MNLCPSCGEPYEIGDWPICRDNTGKHGHSPANFSTPLSAFHESDRPIIYRNPRTGEVRTPARSDQPVPEVYARQGYVRDYAFSNASERVAYERQTGKLHELSHYTRNSVTAERDVIGDAARPVNLTSLDDPSSPRA